MNSEELKLNCDFAPEDCLTVRHRSSKPGVVLMIDENKREIHAELMLTKTAIEELRDFLEDKLRYWDEE
jgi:hypothetical protein